MGLTGDRYLGEYQGHTIEAIYDNWVKTFRLEIDGKEVAKESRILPHDITLEATIEHAGAKHAVVAQSISKFPSENCTVTVDGAPLTLTKVK